MNAIPIKIRGQWWIIKVGVPPTWGDDEITYGETLHDQRVILIYTDTHLSESALIETYLHEILHASIPDLGEEAVRSAAIAQTGLLKILGVIGKDAEND